MYLYVWPNGIAKQVRENPSVIDFLAVKQGTLFIFRFANGFHRLVFTSDSFLWIDVAEAARLTSAPRELFCENFCGNFCQLVVSI